MRTILEIYNFSIHDLTALLEYFDVTALLEYLDIEVYSVIVDVLVLATLLMNRNECQLSPPITCSKKRKKELIDTVMKLKSIFGSCRKEVIVKYIRQRKPSPHIATKLVMGNN